ncbi:MAG: VWA domain-containing protein, partial [Lentisphaerae bacterium]|nr:VWA domain-containing protein [Lentisphaerota bacterium]
MSVTFASAWVLLLLWLVPPVTAWWHFALRRRDRLLLGLVSAHMQKKIQPVSSRTRLRWQTVLIATGLALGIVSAARPQWGTREETVYQRGRDLVIALDVSRSMLARDVHPNRLARAKADLHDLIGELRGDRAALVAFRRSAVLLCPLTTDYTFLRQALDGIDIDSAPPGATDIGAAIEEALEAFESDPGAHKAVILISDGEDLSGRALFAAENAAKRGIPIFTVGLGDRRGAPIPAEDGKGNETYEGIEVTTRLDHDTLHALAETSGGAYVPVGTAGMTSITLGTLYREHLRRITAQDIEETQRRRRVERYQGFLLLSVLLMLTAVGLSPGRLKLGVPAQPETPPAPPPLKDLTPPKKELKAIIVFLALSLATSGHVPASTNTASPTTDSDAPVPPGRRGARQAQTLYRLGQYEKAAETYIAAARGSTKKSQLDFRRNAAAALYRAKAYGRAADLLREVGSMEETENPVTRQALGASLYRSAETISGTNAAAVARARARQLKNAGEAFREAARARGGESAEQDLDLVLGRLPQAEEEARIAGLMETHGNTPAFALIDSVLNNQRDILQDIGNASTNTAPSRIHQFEAAAEKQKKNADLWVPLKGKLMAAIPGEETAPGSPAPGDVEAYIEQVRDSMTDSAEELRDLDPRGPGTAAISEGATYQLWKGIAPYSPILSENIRRQAASREMAETADKRFLDSLSFE